MRQSEAAPGATGVRLLDVRNLHTRFASKGREVTAVHGVNLFVGAGESVGIVGESGSGKSVTSRSILKLIEPPGRIVDGEAWFEDRNLLELPERELCRIRGRKIAMIFQEPVMSLDPVIPIGRQVLEGIRWHLDIPRAEARERAKAFLEAAQLPAPSAIMGAYPHQLSGGMCQRVAIAMALVCEPSLIIADEPTSALDATVQAQILDLLGELQARFHMAILLVSHDLSVISRLCTRTVVMYAGKVVEEGPTADILQTPRHPYTEALVDCIPRFEKRGELPSPIEGEPVKAGEAWQEGCAFAPRCPRAVAECARGTLPWARVGPAHYHRCLVEAADG